MLVEMLGKLRFLNEYGELETVNPGDWEKASVAVEIRASGTGVVSVVSLFTIFFMCTGENG